MCSFQTDTIVYTMKETEDDPVLINITYIQEHRKLQTRVKITAIEC